MLSPSPRVSGSFLSLQCCVSCSPPVQVSQFCYDASSQQYSSFSFLSLSDLQDSSSGSPVTFPLTDTDTHCPRLPNKELYGDGGFSAISVSAKFITKCAYPWMVLWRTHFLRSLRCRCDPTREGVASRILNSHDFPVASQGGFGNANINMI